MSANTAIFIGVLGTLVSAFFLPYGFHLKAKEEGSVQAGTMPPTSHHGDLVGGDKYVFNIGESNSKTKEESFVHVKIQRLLDDYESAFKGLSEKFVQESAKISRDFSVRNSPYSSGHISAHLRHSKTAGEELEAKFTLLTRAIEDLLMEKYKTHDLSSLEQFSHERQRLDKIKSDNAALKKKFIEPARDWDIRINKKPTLTKEAE